MNLNELQNVILKAAKAVSDAEKISISSLAVRAGKVVESYPFDQTAIQMRNFLNDRSKHQAFITRAELRQVYNKLYTHNNKFASHFTEELMLETPKGAKYSNRDPKEGMDITSGLKSTIDPILSNALASAFDPNIEYKEYSDDLAKQAEWVCMQELTLQKLSPKSVKVVAGRKNIIICQATYDTPKGQSNVIIPVEIKQSKALFPTVFLSSEGFMDMNGQSIKNHVLKTAGRQVHQDVNNILQIVLAAKNGVVEPMSNVELALIKVRGSQGEPAFDPSQIINQKVDDKPQEDVSSKNQYVDPEEVQRFSDKLKSSSGAAEFLFGKNAVNQGRELISLAMSNWGFKNTNIAVSDNNNDTIFFAVGINNTGFTVPVKVSNGKASVPQVLVSKSGISEFSMQGVNDIIADASSNSISAVAAASPLFGSKPSTLIGVVEAAMKENNYEKAEEALIILKNSGNERAFDAGFNIYKMALNGKLNNKEDSKCTLQVKNSSSNQILCGHTNLPLGKVFQDHNGQCHPNYRKHIKENNPKDSFLHSKVYFQ